MADSIFKKAVHTEHILFECVVSAANASDVQLFRAPTVHDGSGTHLRLPHQISWRDLKKDDIVVALLTEGLDDSTRVITTLQFWHVLDANDGEATVLVNNIVGSAGDGAFVYDRLAGLVGRPPSSP